MYFVVEGHCVGKQRPRMANGHTYTPKATKDYENKVLDAFVNAENDLDFNGPIEAFITVYVKMPTSWSRKRRAESMGKPPFNIKTPDLDNAAKSILDALNGLAYKDDKQVVSLDISRKWGSYEFVEVRLENV